MFDPIEIQPVGIIHTDYKEKFAVPRQSGLVKSAVGKVYFSSEWKPEETFRKIEGFSHLWLIFQFHQIAKEQEKSLVRPPRLGGNEKVGVFATRSPYHPNRLGLSVVELLAVENDHLLVGGVDLVHGTPIIDIKPYLPYADCLPEALGGFAAMRPEQLDVQWKVSSDQIPPLTHEERQLIEETLENDARPAIHHDPERIYYAQLAHFEVSWRVVGGKVLIIGLREVGE